MYAEKQAQSHLNAIKKVIEEFRNYNNCNISFKYIEIKWFVKVFDKVICSKLLNQTGMSFI